MTQRSSRSEPVSTTLSPTSSRALRTVAPKSRVVRRLVAPVVVVPIAVVATGMMPGTTPPAAACSSYSIDGGIDQPGIESSTTDPTSDSGIAAIEITATAFVHDGGEPLPNHVVWASFTMADGVAPVEPLLAVTDIDGRVSVTLPVGATGVVFRTEAPPSGGCDATGASPSITVPGDLVPGDPTEPEIVMVEIPAPTEVLERTGFGPQPSSDASPVAPIVATALPRTGPGAGGFLLGGLAVAGGAGLVLGRRRPVVPG